ncbi:MAG TPA: hypothetical protein VGS23_08260 [Thermoplasmata archaeon]|nr:hypothetical protein [Thermoplasmata archaeon]
MTAPRVRIISRGINGQLILEGSFDVLHKELAADSRVCLTLADPTRRVSIEIPFEVLEEIAAEPGAEALAERIDQAEDRVIARLRL